MTIIFLACRRKRWLCSTIYVFAKSGKPKLSRRYVATSKRLISFPGDPSFSDNDALCSGVFNESVFVVKFRRVALNGKSGKHHRLLLDDRESGMYCAFEESLYRRSRFCDHT